MNPPQIPGMLKLGSYHGACKITTGKKPIISRLTLKVMRVEAEVFYGRITITGSFKIDQEFSAAVSGKEVQFLTASPKRKLTITWHGSIVDGALNGTFVVVRTGLLASLFRKTSQHGTWHCAKERFPLFRQLKTLAKRSVVGGMVVVAVGGIIALIGAGSSPQPDSAMQFSGSYRDTDAYSAHSPSYQADNFAVRETSSGMTSTPQLSDRHIAELGSHVYDYALNQNRVDVNAHYRGDTFVQAHDRQPPGGYSVGDRAEAAGWAMLAMGTMKAIDYFSPERVEARKNEEATRLEADKRQQEEAVQRMRDHAERMREHKQPWWKR